MMLLGIWRLWLLLYVWYLQKKYICLSSIGCMEHPQISLVCAPQCQTSCTTVCPPSCCTASSLQYRGVYSSPALPLQPVYTNHCPSPCSPSCAPKCSPKCCNAVIYRSQLYLKRKVIGRKSVKKKNKLRKRHKLHQLKKAMKLSQNWGEFGFSETNQFLSLCDIRQPADSRQYQTLNLDSKQCCILRTHCNFSCTWIMANEAKYAG